MTRTPKEYQRLPGRGMLVEGNRLIAVSRSLCSLWLGGDHLLLVERIGYTETYKRFYFRDIQAVMIRKTANGAMTSSILSILALICFLSVLAVDNVPGRVTLLIIGGIFALFTLASFWQGPSCVVHIKTSVQTEQLPPWNRMRTARKGLERLRPRLLETQGAFFPEEIKAELQRRLDICPRIRSRQRVSHMPALAHQHCLNHAAREAAAQCLECRHFFCRECVTEHDERLICAACLRKLSKVEGPRRLPFRALGRVCLSVAGLLTASLFFYWVGQTLLLIPTSFHDGSLWNSPGGSNP